MLQTTLLKHWRVWKMTALNALQETFINRATNVLFFLGKSYRFAMMIVFLLLLRDNINGIGNYTADQMIVFFITYQIVDVVMQVFFRGVYEFGGLVRSGMFDGYLTRPINPLFSVLTGTPDFNDAVFLVPTTLVSIYLIAQADLSITLAGVIWYLLLLLNSFVVGTALHIMIISFTLLTTDVDNVVWMYRDLSRIGQFPISIHFEVIKFILFFMVPIGFMFTVPAQVLLGAPLSHSIVLTVTFTVGFFWLSLQFWKWSLKRYSSASS
ncbi:MAG: ABC transporter permease [bacterium]|nr:ABC transporter permease [bacterium]